MINQAQRAYPNSDSFFLEHSQRYLFVSKFTKNKVVLDLGCGEGYGSIILKKAGAIKVIGLDNDQSIIKMAQKKYSLPSVSFKKGDAYKLPFRDQFFDLVVSLELIEHLANQQKFLNEVKRVLKPQGVFFLSTPNKINYRGLTSPFHCHEFTLKELRSVLSASFKKVIIFGQQIVNHRLLQQEKKFFNFYQRITFGQKWVKKIFLLIPGKLKAYFHLRLIGKTPFADNNAFIISKNNLQEAITFIAMAKK